MDEKIRATLEKQLQLLSKCSTNTSDVRELAIATKSMCEAIKQLEDLNRIDKIYVTEW